MSDERESGDEQNLGEDGELMSDFKGLFPEDEAEAVSAGVALAAKGSAGDALEPDKAAQGLDVGLDGEIFSEEITLDEDEPETALVVEEDAHAGAAAAVAAAPPPIIPPAPVPALSKAQLFGGVALLSSSLLLSLAALWMGMGLGSQIESLNQNVSELQQRVLSQSRRGSLAPQGQLSDQLSRLGEQVNELAMIVEGPVGHLRESNQRALQALAMRLDRLESGQVSQAATAPAKASDIPATNRKPLVSKAEATPSVVAKKTGWVINLLSVSSAKTANAELSHLRKLGIRADKQTVNKEGNTWYRLRVSGFDSYEGAKAYIDTVQKQTGFKSAWVAKE